MGTEDRAFQDYRARPGRDTLLVLLTAHQATVFNISFQVLRSEHDAEDAAQECLLEVVRGIDGVREPRAFKRWLCRAALHTALDHLRLRSRRARYEESRAAMFSSPPDQTAEAIHEALSKLDDDDRCLLVEKYFERATLEEIGARERISAAAVGKRVDRAKERLKQRLSQAGLAAFVPGVDALLESIRPVPIPPDLVASSMTVNAALAGVGGAIMGTKAVISGTTIAVALVFLMIGAGSGYLVGAKRGAGSPTPESRHRGAAVEGTVGSMDLASTPAAKGVRSSPAADPESATDSPAESNSLVARLDRFKDWLKDYDGKRKNQSPQDMERRLLMLKDELEGVRELILADPAAFLAWIGQRQNGAILGDLLDATIAEKPSLYAIKSHDFNSFPASLTDGFLLLLQNGDESQRRAVIAFARFLRNPPEAYRSQFVAMLSDPDIFFVGPQAAQALLSTPEPTGSEIEAVVRYAERLENDVSRQLVVQGLGRVPRPETREWLLQALESDRFPDPRGRLAWAALEWWIDPGRSPGPAFEDRAAKILASAMKRTTDTDGYFMSLYTALNLPIAKSLPVIEQAVTGAPTEKLRKAAAAVLQKARVEGAGARTLQDLLISANSEK